MRGKHVAHHRNTGYKQMLSVVLSLAVLCYLLPVHGFALDSGSPSDYPYGPEATAPVTTSTGAAITTSTGAAITTSTDAVVTGDGLLPEGTIPAAGKTPRCTCAENCTDESINSDCPVCAGDHTLCEGIPQIEFTLPIYELEERELNNTTEDGALVKVSGLLPTAAELEVTVVPKEDVTGFVEEDAQVLFAYDIKIKVPAATVGDTPADAPPEMIEYQPSVPVNVSIAPPEDTPIETPVAVTHVAVDTKTGETTPQAVENVVTTDAGEVEFEAEGFSVFVVTIIDDLSSHTIDFPVGDYTVEYSTAESGPFTVLTSTSVSLGSTAATGLKYDTLYFKVTANQGYTLGAVAANSGTLMLSNGVYALNVSGAASSITLTIPVTGVKITGIPAQGATLTAASSGLSGLAYNWKICDTAGGTYSSISGQTAETLTLSDTEYNDKYIQVVVTATGTSPGTYTSAPVGPITSDGTIIFDLEKGFVEIGLLDNGNRIYRGYNSAGALVGGTHADTNKYEVMQSNSGTETANNIILTGYASVPEYYVTLNGVNCATYANKVNCGIYMNAINSTPMRVTLRLSGYNYVGRVHYATSGMSSLDPTIQSSLTITSASGDGSNSGYLVATSLAAWSAAIGGVDERASEASRNIFIKGGTINAIGYGSDSPSSTTGTCAIGGGGNGACNIEISGGVITATNNGTGATIGGGGGNNTEGGAASVTITGGSVTASNNYVGGVAIGGGSSNEALGSMAEVTISGGTVTTTGSIGGGSSQDSNGGDATIHISGGKVTVNDSGNIGGGSSKNANGGSVSVTITGGTVVTPHISGGYSGSSGTYKDAALSIAAASVNIDDRSNINSVIGPDPISGTQVVVFSQIIDIDELEDFSSTGSVTVSNATLDDSNTYYLVDVYPDNDGKLYFWLPVDYDVTSLTIDGEIYPVAGAQVQTATITHSSSTVGTVLRAVLNYGTPTYYKWQISDNNSTWNDIAGATGSAATSYTVVQSDVGKYIQVVITAAGNPDPVDVISGSLRITDTPYASITYSSLEAPTTLTAQLLNGTVGAYTYKWQMYNNSSNTYEDIAGETGGTLSTDYSHIAKRIRAIITDGGTNYTTTYVVILPPQLSVTVPTAMLVTVNAAGQCTVNGGQIENRSAVPVYVTNIAFEWVTGGSSDANELFHDYTDASANLRLGSTTYTFTGASPSARLPSATEGTIPAKNEDIPGTLTLPWDFSLGTGNYLKLAPATGESVHVATVTYTVDYIAPTTP